VVLAPVPAVGIAGFAVVGLGAAAIVPVAWSVAAQKEPAAPGRAIAAVATCGYLGFLVGPVLVGALASAIGLAGAVAAAGASALVVFLLAPSLRVAARLPR
jgi:MFS family permease